MSDIQEQLIELFQLDGAASIAEYLADYTDSTKQLCTNDTQRELVDEYSRELYDKFKMDTAKYPIVARLEETILMNMSEDEVKELLRVINSPNYIKLYECLSIVLDEFKYGLDDIDSVVDIEPVEREIKVLM
jgi:hypothetical protein